MQFALKRLHGQFRILFAIALKVSERGNICYLNFHLSDKR